ncbi:MAG: hypothetical protein J5533_08880 [Bacteroidales bacterium]|nr:hypothetical protein [Bacteroidales bacterium]
MKTINTFLSFVAVSVVAALCLDACSPEKLRYESAYDDSVQYEFISDDVPAELTRAEIDQINDFNSFAFKTAGYISQAQKTKSFVFSPVSLGCLLGMLSEGSDAKTQGQVCKALGIPDQQDLNEFSRKMIVRSQRAALGNESFELANCVVVSDKVKLLADYRKALKNNYDAEAETKDFYSENVANYVNEWAAEKTHNRITHVLDIVLPSLDAVLMNALYFKATWANQFSKGNTRECHFFGADNKTRKEMTMKMESYLRYYKGNDFSSVTLPYGNVSGSENGRISNFSMTILLPDRGNSVESMFASIDKAELYEACSIQNERVGIKLSLPRFEIQTAQHFGDILADLGVQKINLSNMADKTVDAGNNILQVANITVDEDGSEAAAVSVTSRDAGEIDTSKYIEFNCDRPFLFVITENTTGAILFLGCFR